MYDLNVSTYLLNLPKRLKIRLYMYSAIYVGSAAVQADDALCCEKQMIV